MTKLSGKMWVFVHVGIHNTSRKFHLSKLNFTKIKTNNIRMKSMKFILIHIIIQYVEEFPLSVIVSNHNRAILLSGLQSCSLLEMPDKYYFPIFFWRKSLPPAMETVIKWEETSNKFPMLVIIASNE